MEYAVVVKTSQNVHFFIKSTHPALCHEDPHGICTQAKHVDTVHWLTGRGSFSVQFTKVVEWNMQQFKPASDEFVAVV